MAVHSFTLWAALHCLILELTPGSDMVYKRMKQTLIRKVLQIYAPYKVNHNKRLLFQLAVKKTVKIKWWRNLNLSNRYNSVITVNKVLILCSWTMVDWIALFSIPFFTVTAQHFSTLKIHSPQTFQQYMTILEVSNGLEQGNCYLRLPQSILKTSPQTTLELTMSNFLFPGLNKHKVW